MDRGIIYFGLGGSCCLPCLQVLQHIFLFYTGSLYPYGNAAGDKAADKADDDQCNDVYYYNITMFGNSFSRLYVSIYNVMMYITIILLCLVTLSVDYM